MCYKDDNGTCYIIRRLLLEVQCGLPDDRRVTHTEALETV